MTASAVGKANDNSKDKDKSHKFIRITNVLFKCIND